MDKNPIAIEKRASAVILKHNDGYGSMYKIHCADGLGLMTVYPVYPGIQLIYNDFEATSCCWDEKKISIKIYWKSTTAVRGVKVVGFPVVLAFILERVIYLSIQWITVHQKCRSH